MKNGPQDDAFESAGVAGLESKPVDTSGSLENLHAMCEMRFVFSISCVGLWIRRCVGQSRYDGGGDRSPGRCPSSCSLQSICTTKPVCSKNSEQRCSVSLGRTSHGSVKFSAINHVTACTRFNILTDSSTTSCPSLMWITTALLPVSKS